jgi:hypothetical protein
VTLRDDEKAAEQEFQKASIRLREAKTALKLAEDAFQQAHLRYAEFKARRITVEAVTPTTAATATHEWQEFGTDRCCSCGWTCSTCLSGTHDMMECRKEHTRHIEDCSDKAAKAIGV